MRRLVLSVTFLLLIGGLLLLRSYRFERLPGAPPLSLADLRKAAPALPPGAAWTGSPDRPSLRLVVKPGDKRVSLRMELPGIPAVEALHLRFKMSASNLAVGRNEWDDGRLLIQWRSPDGASMQETDPVCSVREDETSGVVSLVVRPISGSAVPVLCVQHLGSGGEFRISDLEMNPVKQRAAWHWSRWVMLVLWFSWVFGFLSDGSQTPSWRRATAAAIWILMGVTFAFPGPWKTLRPFVIPYDLGPVIVENADLASKPAKDGKTVQPPPAAPPPSGIHEALGRIPPQGGWLIQTKVQLAKIRPLLHGLLLFAPALAFAWLLGRKRALILSVGLAISIEASQTAFGYGFGWDDVFDLISDAAGIGVAWWVHRWFKERQFGKLRNH